MKKVIVLASVLSFLAVQNYNKWQASIHKSERHWEIQTSAAGLKEALNNGITKEVTKLTATDGFLKIKPLKFCSQRNCRKLIKP